MAVKNYYPHLPEVPYRRTSVEMAAVLVYLRSLSVPKVVKVAAYVIFRNESRNGQSGINNNYVGAQADSGVWPSHLNGHFVGVVRRVENMRKAERLFLAFDDFKGSVDFLIDRVQQRGLYVGGTPGKIFKSRVDNAGEWTQAYWAEWVTGSKSEPIPAADKAGLLSMYRQGEKLL